MTGRSYSGEAIEPFVSDEQRALWPDISGNDINGLGETARPNIGRMGMTAYLFDPRHPFGSPNQKNIPGSRRQIKNSEGA